METTVNLYMDTYKGRNYLYTNRGGTQEWGFL